MTSFLAVMLLWLGAVAQAADSFGEPENLRPELPPGFSIDARSFVFPSGLRVIMQPDHSAPIVAITTYIDHGSSSDPKGKEGIAHFLEHMWFKSRHIEGSQVKTWDVLKDMGCALNASTSMDWTNYMTVCPKGSLPTLMRFASLRLTDTVKGVKPEEADSEREVIRNELRMRSEGRFEGRAIYQYTLKSLFPQDHPYNRLGIGTHDSLDNVALEDIADFADRFYRPEETTIVVVGDFEPQEAGSLIVENFDLELLHPDLTEDHVRFAPRPGVSLDEINPRNPDREKVYFVAMDPANPQRPLDIEGLEPVNRAATFGRPPGDPATTELQTYRAPITNTAAVVAWSLPAGYQGNDIIGRVAANQIYRQLYSTFYDEYDVVKDEYGRPETGCGYLGFQMNSIMYCATEIKEGRNAARWTDKMLDQLSSVTNPELLANSITRQILERNFGLSRLYFLQYTLNSMDRVSGLGAARATQLGDYAHHTGDHRYYSAAMEEFGQIQLGDILNYATEYITRDRAARFVLEPIPEDELVLDSSESDYAGADSEDDLVVSMLDDDEITRELIERQVVTPDLDAIIDRTLPNGLRVVVYPHGEAPLSTIRLVSKGGALSDVRATDAVMDRFASEGFDPALEPLRIAGAWNDGPPRGREGIYTWIGMDSPSLNADEAMWYLRRRLEGIAPDMEGKGTYVREFKKGLLRNWRNPKYWRGRLTREALGPIDHPAFGVTTYEHWEWRKKLKRSQVQDYLDQRYHPENMVLVAVGAYEEPEAIFDAAERYFSGWKTDAERYEPIPQPGEAEIPEHEPVFYVVNQPRRTQSEVEAYCRLANGGPESSADRRVLSTMLNGLVFQELRAKEGIAYSPGAGVQSRVGGNNTLIMTGLFQNDAVGIATDTFLRAMEGGARGEFPMNRFKPAQMSLARQPVLGLQAIADVAGQFVDVVGEDRGFESWTEYPEQLSSVTPEALQDIMAPCPDSIVVTYTGPKDILEPVLEEAGIDYELIDARPRALEMYDQYSRRDAKKLRKQMEKDAEEQTEEEADDGDDDSDDEDE